MFGIWVFTSQGARGSLVLKCGSSMQEGRDPSGPSGARFRGCRLLLRACSLTARMLPLSPGLLLCQILPVLEAGCAPGSTHLGRQAGKLAFTEPFLPPSLWADWSSLQPLPQGPTSSLYK